MKDKLVNTKKHLKTQIDTAKKMDSKWVYILVTEAEKCLELAEAEDTIFMDPVHAETRGEGITWWYACSECHSSLNPHDKYCHECGRKILYE